MSAVSRERIEWHQQRYDEAEAEILGRGMERFAALLERIEWHQQRWNGVASCPCCDGYRPTDYPDPPQGHYSGCELAALKALAAALSGNPETESER